MYLRTAGFNYAYNERGNIMNDICRQDILVTDADYLCLFNYFILMSRFYLNRLIWQQQQEIIV